MNMKLQGDGNWYRDTKRKSVSVLLHQLQLLHELPWDLAQASIMRSFIISTNWQLTKTTHMHTYVLSLLGAFLSAFCQSCIY
jgi:hypothetical protein